MRFPESATIAARKGAFALVYPGAFNLTTGALHWELLARAALALQPDLRCHVQPRARHERVLQRLGPQTTVDPMAKVLVEADETETIIEAEIDGAKIVEARKNIPRRTQRRFDVYPDVSQGKIQFEEPSS